MHLPRDVGVVIVAAGRGDRLGGNVPKQYLPIAGIPMLLRAIRPFSAHPAVRQLVVVLPASEVAAPPAWLAPYVGDALRVVAGGAERHDSVRHGLAALDPACDVVLVHDAARPLVSRALIDAVIAAARGGDGAVPAVPVTDTLKRVTADGGHVAATVPRDGLVRAQTPQGFPRAMLLAAHAQSAGEGATDDAALAERAGLRVRLVPGDPRNLKVTTGDDLLVAAALLADGA
ncbi:MAG: 2-C-methyl-D-erythritol 4-phosphate cytidylyltransferase [Gemmatimonadales bacterium]|nr:2-C-methyl-D-erythritol 4-phosphate cytidylyltransferase [Gemmatimonadales bacterium]